MDARVLVVDDSITLRRVVKAILCRNGYACTVSADGREALTLLDTEKVDLILLDFVMPRMNGYQFCWELRACEARRDLPVVLMSARAERIRDQFLKQTGALDAITKPFDSKALIAVVEGALERRERRAQSRAPKAPRAEIRPDKQALVAGTESLSPSSALTLSEITKLELAHALAQSVTSALATEFGQDIHADRVQGVFENALTDGKLTEDLQRVRWLTIGRNARDVLYGDIETIPIGEILQLLQMQRQNGILELSNRKTTISIDLRDGLVDLAQCKNGGEELFLGRYLLEKGLVSDETIHQARKATSERPELLGSYLLDSGEITKDALDAALIQQSREIIYESLRWPRGWFVLRRDTRSPAAKQAKLGIPIASIVMEGFRRADEWRLIEEMIDFEDVLIRDESAISEFEREQLTQLESGVLERIDGRRKAREIIEQSHQSSFDVCKAFYRLLKSRLIRTKAA
ncbi:MAG: response regulator [Sorangium cellulosum]|nr:MAG: response regulator [Sorangium cellulosum]